MKAISEDEFRERLAPIFDSIFARPDPFNEPFAPDIKPRLLLYGFRYSLHDPWTSPFIESVKDLEQEGFYASILNRPGPEDQSIPYHWYVPLSDIKDYGERIGAAENAIYSTVGGWGIICSHEDHALIGGSEKMIDRFRLDIPDLMDRVYEFLDVWLYYHERNRADISWIPGLLQHIYGEADAPKIIKRSPINSQFKL
jgi:hypothetical protein